VASVTVNHQVSILVEVTLADDRDEVKETKRLILTFSKIKNEKNALDGI